MSFAQIDNTVNPFTDPKDAGTAEQVGLLGTDENQGDGLVNVIK